jgi:predicted RNA-binding protein
MCQLRAVLERDGREETVMDSITALDVVDDGVVLSTFFEEPMKIEGVQVRRIDFLGGILILQPINELEGVKDGDC